MKNKRDITEARATISQSAFLHKHGYKCAGLTRAEATKLIKNIHEAERAGKALGKFMRERRDVLEAQEALLGSDAPITLTPDARKAIAVTLKRTLDFVPADDQLTRDAIRQWLEILVPEME